MDDSLVVDQLVLLFLFHCVYRFCFSITFDEVWIFKVDHLSVGTADFSTHGREVEFLSTTVVQSKASHFADCFSILGLVSIVFCPSGDKGGKAIIIVQLVGKLPQIIPSGGIHSSG